MSITLSKKYADNKGKGSYVLITRLPEERTITVGSLQCLYFPRGEYAYVGSALKGFKARLSHHLRQNKKPHWHIDYLLQRASISSIILCESQERTECTIAQTLSPHFTAIPGFGASDCRCYSHLFWAADSMKEEIMTILKALDMKPKLFEKLELEFPGCHSGGVPITPLSPIGTTKNLRVGAVNHD